MELNRGSHLAYEIAKTIAEIRKHYNSSRQDVQFNVNFQHSAQASFGLG